MMHKWGLLRVVLLHSFAVLTISAAQLPAGAIDTGFSPVVDARVMDVDLQSDGKLVIGGEFTNVDGKPRNQLARLHSDGTLDDTFRPGVAMPGEAMYRHRVQKVLIQQDGKILAAGDRTFWNNPSLTSGQGHYVARFNSDGTLDPFFTIWISTNQLFHHSILTGLQIQADGTIPFSSTQKSNDGLPRLSEIVRLHRDGTLDTGFDAPEFIGMAWPEIPLLAVLSNRKLLLGPNLIRLNPDGSKDESFGADEVGPIASVDFLKSGLLMAVGSRLVRLNTDGTRDRSFEPVELPGSQVAVRGDGKIVIAGHGGFSLTSTVKLLNPDGSADLSFGLVTLSNSTIVLVDAVDLQPDGKIVVAGLFSSVNDLPRPNLVRILAPAPSVQTQPEIQTQPTSQVTQKGKDATFSTRLIGLNF